MYDYRHNYYGDVIDYLDKKDRGINVEPPKPQTWAERVLRTVKEYEKILNLIEILLTNRRFSFTASHQHRSKVMKLIIIAQSEVINN